MRFALTLTLRPKWYSLSIDQQYQLAREEIDALHVTDIHVLAELTKIWNVHFHGIIEAPYERTIFDTFRKSKVFGFMCVKEIGEPKGWVEYCYKECDKTQSNMMETEIRRGEYHIRDMLHYVT